jgi:hypothetical protein
VSVVRRYVLITLVTCLAASGGLAGTAAAPASAETVWATCSTGVNLTDDCTSWYRTNVTVDWHWLPADGVGTGCNSQILSQDSPPSGTPEACHVAWESTARTADLLIRIKVDKTPPNVTDATPARGPDQGGWYNHPVEFAFHGADATSGLQSCSSVSYNGPDSGTATVTGTCQDVAGNVASRSIPLRYDATPPTVVDITPSRPPDHDGWYNAPVDFGFTGIDATSGLDGCPTVSYRGPDGADTRVTGTCTDRAGNTASRSLGINYDATPPALDDLSATGGNHSATLTWQGSPDTVSLVIVRSRVTNPRIQQPLLPGLESGFRDTGLKNGVEYRYDLSAADAAGNSAHSAVSVVPSAHPRLRPRPGASVASPPLLRWPRVTRASYYNVQLYRDDAGVAADTSQPPPGSVKILSRWPSKPHFHLRRSWKYGGHRLRLVPGHYRWFVWAGYGARSKQRFGGQIVNSTFTVTR